MQYRKFVINPTDGYFKDISELTPPRNNKGYLHLVLFLLTVLTTTFVGAFMWSSNYGGDTAGFAWFLRGIPFSATLLSILGVHEFAHYFTAKYWGIQVTLPYFIPAPIPPLGTFGAIIKMKSSIPSRRALIDVGASGPMAGFVFAVAASCIGLKLSRIVPMESLDEHIGYILGEPLLFKFLGFLILGPVGDNFYVELHPVAFAGWIGFFVTALNLIPVGQLDGGHILFALSPRTHELVRRIRLPILILLGLTFWNGWYVWAVFSLFFGRSHPYPDRMDTSVGKGRTVIAVITILIFLLCITLTPIKIG